MPEVFLDGAIVTLSGPPPATVDDVRLLLENTLAQQDRLLSALQVDGVAWSDELGARAWSSVHRLDAASLTVAAALAQVAAAASAAIGPVREQADRLASDVLRVGWADAQERCVALVEAMRGVLEHVATLAAQTGGEGSFGREVEALAQAIGVWMDAIKGKDAAAVCLRLDGEVLPALERVAALVGAMHAPSA